MPRDELRPRGRDDRVGDHAAAFDPLAGGGREIADRVLQHVAARSFVVPGDFLQSVAFLRVAATTLTLTLDLYKNDDVIGHLEFVPGSNTTSGGTDPCSPPASSCPQVASSKCIALEDNSASKLFTLRMANLTLTAPPSLTKGLVKGVVQNGVTMNLAGCNLNGGGTFSWLLEFNTETGALRTGGGKPADDPTKGYSFVDETIMQGGKPFKIAPFTADAPITAGSWPECRRVHRADGLGGWRQGRGSRRWQCRAR